MSVILKALKKLEQESADHSSILAAGAEEKQVRLGIRKKIFPVLAVCILCAVIVAGTTLFSRKLLIQEPADLGLRSVPKQTTPGQMTPQNRTPVLAAPGLAPEFSDSSPQTAAEILPPEGGNEPRELAASAPSDLPADIAGSVKPADPILPVMPMPEIKKENPSSGVEKSQSVVDSGTEMAVEDPPVPEQPVSVPAPKPVIPKAEPRVAIIEDPALSLQAISWSEDPEKRLAIINGHICREKEAVEGYVIDAIHSGEVVISKGGKAGKLVFKIR
ncbi:MAG: hypothetical protein COX19_14015 [Desulfobacterales bacterium CG23_combo_of_CG06-09_8_20_14_all_51_8]|nr:MAG: hypothetical protein COX19_14015 [Desulfobacterales bacterium CG23_combo_of_CG06-09_8_20_14_all_51_8]